MERRVPHETTESPSQPSTRTAPRRARACSRSRHLPLVAALLLPILLCIDLTTAGAIEEPDRLWRVALGAFADRLYPTARDVLEQFVARYPRDRRAGDAWLLLGKTRAALGDLVPAADAFRRAGKAPSSGEHALEARYLEAETLFQLKRYAEARRAYADVLATDAASPRAPDAVYGLAWVDLEERRPDAAIAAFRQLLEAWPDYPRAADATLALGRTLVELHRYGEAVAPLATVLARFPKHPSAADARYLLGWARLESGATAAGVADLRAFAAMKPSHELTAVARHKIAEGVLRLGDPRELAQEYRTLMTVGPATAESLHDAFTIAGRLGRAWEQEAAVRRLQQQFPDHALTRQATLEQARTALQQKKHGRAIALARALAQSDDPKTRAEGLLITGEAQLAQKDYQAALRAFEAAAAIPEADASLRFRALAGRGAAYEGARQWANALREYQKVLAGSTDAELREWASARSEALKAQQPPSPRKSATRS
jgi:TolA-binding protein